jgi:hypothetical protein
MGLFEKCGTDKERPEGKSPLAVYGRTIVNKYSRERLEVVDWIDLAHDRERGQGSGVTGQVLVNVMMKHRVA